MNKTTERLLQIGIVVAIIIMFVCAGCVVTFTINQWRNSDILTKAQAEVYKAQADNIGKPVIIEQNYNTKLNK